MPLSPAFPPAEFILATPNVRAYVTRTLEPAAARSAIGGVDVKAELRGLPADLDFGPPEPELVHEVVHSTSPILQAHARQRHNGTGEPAQVSASATTPHAEAL